MKSAIVTGSSSGLGLEITKSLIELGFQVFGGSRSGTDFEHERFYDVELDVSSEESVVEFYETIKDFTDEIHLAVNNAGICEMSSLASTLISIRLPTAFKASSNVGTRAVVSAACGPPLPWRSRRRARSA